jgi:hypothetical protein
MILNRLTRSQLMLDLDGIALPTCWFLIVIGQIVNVDIPSTQYGLDAGNVLARLVDTGYDP